MKVDKLLGHKSRCYASGMRFSRVVVCAVLFIACVACGKKPSVEECTQMVDHSMQLELVGKEDRLIRSVMAQYPEMKPAMIAECVKSVTRKHVACALAATDVKTLEDCQEVN